MNYAVMGYGNRGMLYTDLFVKLKDLHPVAVCEKQPVRLERAKKEHGDRCKTYCLSEEEFFAKGKLADLLVIATQDRDHYDHAIAALNAGYDLLLEKPIAETLEKCSAIYQLATELGRKVFVCHVLRYAPFFALIKRELDSGKYGTPVTINLTENVAFWHQAHSYVRGNWANTKKSTPMILAKCCHDLDILNWLMDGTACKSVSSFGSLTYFTPANAPEGSAEYCFECPVKDRCKYNCKTVYRPDDTGWMIRVLDPWCGGVYTEETVRKALEDKTNPYARCVFRSDNDAVDHQVTNLLFDNGATAHLTMTAFSKACRRDIHVHCTCGDIYGNMDDNALVCNTFGGETKGFYGESKTIDVNLESDTEYGHGGGDLRLVEDIIASYEGKPTKGLTSIAHSFASHCVGFAAEESRLKGGALVSVEKF